MENHVESLPGKTMEISLNLLESLIEIGIEPSHLFILELYNMGINPECLENTQVLGWRQKLIRKGFLSSMNEVTEAGKMMLQGRFSSSKEVVKLARKQMTEKNKEGFDLWWSEYVSTDGFFYKGKRFSGVQSKKVKKDICAVIFQEILNKREFTEDEIIRGTKNHILIAKEQSLKKGASQLSFIPNSERYLRERCFAGFIDSEIDTGETKMVDTKSLFNG